MSDRHSIESSIDPELALSDEERGGLPGVSRRGFVHTLGAGLLLTVIDGVATAQRRGGGFGGFGGGPVNVAARIHIGVDGAIHAMSGKVELGQGARAELTQAAAEELRVAPERVTMILADTALVPNDGLTAGSQTTPRVVPAMRKAAAAARELLVSLACKRWQVDAAAVEFRPAGGLAHAASGRTLSYADLARAENVDKLLARPAGSDVSVTPVRQWKTLGQSLPRPNARDLVTGAHRFASDIMRPGMLYGKVLRPPSYGATLESIDMAPAKAMPGVVALREGSFVGCAAPTALAAAQAIEAIAKTAVWKTVPHPSSKNLFEYLKDPSAARRPGPGPGSGRGRGGRNPGSETAPSAARSDTKSDVKPDAGKSLSATYQVAYIQHAPMETRAGVAEWNGDKLTVWASTANPFGVRSDLAAALGVSADAVHVIVPDVGGAFGGKHQAEAAVEAARLARAAGKPVSVHWTREEEFTWAYFRPAGLLEMRGELQAGKLVAWEQVNINSGGASLDTPYDVGRKSTRSVGGNSPLRQGSYRALAATANNFAREAFMDELAHAAGADPLEFRLAHLSNQRLRTVLTTAAEKFGWAERSKRRAPNIGVGLACGTEKNSVVAACVEVEVDPADRAIRLRHICEVFECGKVLNPANLLSQVQGCIVMGLGAALWEEIRFEGGEILNPQFSRYRVPKFKDVPRMDIHLLDRPDMDAIGGGETPIVAVAPAIANAVFQITGVRLRSMPLRLRAETSHG